MDLQIVFEAAAKWGLGIVLAIILIFMFKRFLNRAFDSFAEERKNYMDLLGKQSNVVENHLSHLTQASADLNGEVKSQRLCMDHGFEKVVSAIESQTAILKPIRRTRKSKGGSSNET